MSGGGRGRRLGSILVPILVGAALLWAAGRMTWVTAEVFNDKSGESTHTVGGSTWAMELTPIALVLLALVAVFAMVGPRLTRVLGGLLAIAATAEAVSLVLPLRGGISTDRVHELLTSGTTGGGSTLTGTGGLPGGGTGIPAWAEVTSAVLHPEAAAVAVAGLVLILVSGVLALLRPPPRAQRSAGSAYDAPAVRRERARARGTSGDLGSRDMWDALDAGEDPTDGPASPATDVTGH